MLTCAKPDLDGYRIYYDTGSGEPYGGTDASCAGGDPCPSPITLTINDPGDPDKPEYTLIGLHDNEVYFLSLLSTILKTWKVVIQMK